MANYPGLYPRPIGIWYVRKKVPKDLRHAVEGDQVRRSLGTGDRILAVELYPLKLAEITEGFKKLREELAAQGVMAAALKTARPARPSSARRMARSHLGTPTGKA